MLTLKAAVRQRKVFSNADLRIFQEESRAKTGYEVARANNNDK